MPQGQQVHTQRALALPTGRKTCCSSHCPPISAPHQSLQPVPTWWWGTTAAASSSSSSSLPLGAHLEATSPTGQPMDPRPPTPPGSTANTLMRADGLLWPSALAGGSHPCAGHELPAGSRTCQPAQAALEGSPARLQALPASCWRGWAEPVVPGPQVMPCPQRQPGVRTAPGEAEPPLLTSRLLPRPRACASASHYPRWTGADNGS